jgi:hypothetical protein
VNVVFGPIAGFGAGVGVMVTNWLLLTVIVRRWLGSFQVPALVVDEFVAQNAESDAVVAAFGAGELSIASEGENSAVSPGGEGDAAPLPRERRSAVRYFALLLMPLKIAYVGMWTYLCIGVLHAPALWYVGGAIVGLGAVTTMMILRPRKLDK